MYKLLFLLALLLTSCAPYAHIGTGRSIGRHLMNLYFDEGHSDDLRTRNIEVQLFQPVKIIDSFYADWGVGITGYKITSESSQGISGDIVLRLRYDIGIIEPYIFAQHGFGSWSPKLDRQDTHYGFPTSIGIGSRFQIFEKQWIFADYRVLHESNGHPVEVNPGFNTDMICAGIEFEF